MSRFRVEHPTNATLHAEAGHDALLGFYVDVMTGHRLLKSYDHFNPAFNRETPLLGCLGFLVSEGFFTGSQLEDALVYLKDDGREPRRDVMRVVQIVIAMKRAE